jgi:hypothetical protein
VPRRKRWAADVPTLETTDGKPLDPTADPDAVNAAFAAAASADPTPDEQAPPRRQPRTAPADGAPKQKRSYTRKPKEDQSRTADKAPEAAPAPPSPEVTAKRAASAEETFRLAGTCLLLVGKVTHMPSFTADGFVVNANAAPLAEKLADVAAVEPQIAKWLDKAPSAKVTAWLGLASVVGGLGLQAAANHKLLKPGQMGTSDPAEIIRLNEEALEAQQKAAEEEAPFYASQAEEFPEAQHEPAAA